MEGYTIVTIRGETLDIKVDYRDHPQEFLEITQMTYNGIDVLPLVGALNRFDTVYAHTLRHLRGLEAPLETKPQSN